MFGWLKKTGKAIKKGVHHELVGLDDFISAESGGPIGETLSSRSQRAADRGNWLGKGMTKFLHLFQKDHGRKAQQGDIRRAKQVIDLEEHDK